MRHRPKKLAFCPEPLLRDPAFRLWLKAKMRVTAPVLLRLEEQERQRRALPPKASVLFAVLFAAFAESFQGERPFPHAGRMEVSP
jgi:hypothetical protein